MKYSLNQPLSDDTSCGPDFIFLTFLHLVLQLKEEVTHILLLFTISFFRKGKHKSVAKTHLDEIIGFFAKIDPSLGNLAGKSMPGSGDASTSDNNSKKSSSTGAAKKRKNHVKESPDASPKKKANVGNNGTTAMVGMTLSQREKRAMELLASYLEERGGMF